MPKPLFLRDIALAFRHGGGALAGLSFYLLVFTLFAFALGPEELAVTVPGILCVTLLLSSIISLPYLYERDVEDGTLELLLIQPLAAEWLAGGKMLAFWVAHALPLVLAAPCLAYLGNMPGEAIGVFSVRLGLASIAITATGSLGAALTLQRKGGALARALILLPLYIPVLIFTAASTEQSMPTLLLAAWGCLLTPLSAYLSGWLLRVANS